MHFEEQNAYHAFCPFVPIGFLPLPYLGIKFLSCGKMSSVKL